MMPVSGVGRKALSGAAKARSPVAGIRNGTPGRRRRRLLAGCTAPSMGPTPAMSGAPYSDGTRNDMLRIDVIGILDLVPEPS